MHPDRFTKVVIATIAKRAAQRCSNPDCGAVTSGPSDDPSKSVNVGMAAHIYGANQGSARYDPAMTSVARSDISNAIWLCGNCHKLVDDDPTKYPAGLLFEWQREHERRVANIVGKAGAALRLRYEERHLEDFGRLSYLAERIILDKDRFWEYRLTAEVLRSETSPILRRWRALERGLYTKRNYNVAMTDCVEWMLRHNTEILQIAQAFAGLMNEEFAKAWGELGVPGDDIAIVTTCRLYAEALNRAVEWEEMVRFAQVPDVFEDLQKCFIGAATGMISEAAKLPPYLQELFAEGIPEPGTYTLNLTISLPDGWAETVHVAAKRATDAIIAQGLGLSS